MALLFSRKAKKHNLVKFWFAYIFLAQTFRKILTKMFVFANIFGTIFRAIRYMFFSYFSFFVFAKIFLENLHEIFVLANNFWKIFIVAIFLFFKYLCKFLTRFLTFGKILIAIDWFVAYRNRLEPYVSFDTYWSDVKSLTFRSYTVQNVRSNIIYW